MCICLYTSNINFFYSNFLSFPSVPAPHQSGLGWLCTGFALEVAQSIISAGTVPKGPQGSGDTGDSTGRRRLQDEVPG